MKAFIKKYWKELSSSVVFFLLGYFSFKPFTYNSITRNCIFSICGLYLILRLFLYLRRVLTFKKNYVKPAEDTYKYTSPFPEIDSDKGQSALVNEMYHYVKASYGYSLYLDIDKLSKICVYADLSSADNPSEGAVEITKLCLPKKGLDPDSLEWKTAASHILEDFEEKCKLVLGDLK